MDDQERHCNLVTTLVTLWIHHNGSRLRWPSVILGFIFVAITLLVDKVTVPKLTDITAWGIDVVRYGAGIPMLLIGSGIMVILYMMTRAGKIMKILEDKLDKLGAFKQPSFEHMNHPPGGFSGAKLIWYFMALIALGTLILGILFFLGINWYVVPVILIAIAFWIVLCVYEWR